MSACRMVLVAMLVGAGTVAGCAEGPVAPPSVGPLSVTPTHQWAGGSVTLEADGLGNAADLVVRVDGEPYPPSPSAPLGDSLRIRLPTTANGPIEIVARNGARMLGSVTVEAYGFEEMRSYPVRLVKYVKPWPLAAGLGLVGIYELPALRVGGAAVLELGSGTTARFDDLHAPECRAPIVGLQPGHLVVCTEAYEPPAYEYRLAAEPQLEREMPFPLVLFYNALLSPGVVLHGYHHFVTTSAFDDTSTVRVADVRTEEVHGVEVLAGHDRAMVESHSVSVPVFETSTGALVYELDPEVALGSHSVTSSEERGLFYVVGWSPGTLLRLLTVEAETGAIVDSLRYARGEGGGWDEVEYEPDRDILLLSVSPAESLLVLDAGTLNTIGTIDLAGHYPDHWWDSKIFVDPDSGRGYIVFTETEHEETTPAIEFRLPPKLGPAPSD